MPGRSRLIDELCEQFGYSRKHAIKLLGAKAGWGGDPSKAKERTALYGNRSAVGDVKAQRTGILYLFRGSRNCGRACLSRRFDCVHLNMNGKKELRMDANIRS